MCGPNSYFETLFKQIIKESQTCFHKLNSRRKYRLHHLTFWMVAHKLGTKNKPPNCTIFHSYAFLNSAGHLLHKINLDYYELSYLFREQKDSIGRGTTAIHILLLYSRKLFFRSCKLVFTNWIVVGIPTICCMAIAAFHDCPIIATKTSISIFCSHRG